MKPVTLEDITGLGRYEQIRDDFRRRVIALKRARRLAVGDRITFVFENFDTVLFQIQEMLRAERITDLDRVREEMQVYNELIPSDTELSSTMLIEITEQEQIRPQLQKLIGIDECVHLEVGGSRIQGVFEGGRSSDEKLSAVQYVRFAFDAGTRASFGRSDVPARLVIDHPSYSATAEITGDVRESLKVDLGLGS